MSNDFLFRVSRLFGKSDTTPDEALRRRVAAALLLELNNQQHQIDPYRVWQRFDMGRLA